MAGISHNDMPGSNGAGERPSGETPDPTSSRVQGTMPTGRIFEAGGTGSMPTGAMREPERQEMRGTTFGDMPGSQVAGKKPSGETTGLSGATPGSTSSTVHGTMPTGGAFEDGGTGSMPTGAMREPEGVEARDATFGDMPGSDAAGNKQSGETTGPTSPTVHGTMPSGRIFEAGGMSSMPTGAMREPDR